MFSKLLRDIDQQQVLNLFNTTDLVTRLAKKKTRRSVNSSLTKMTTMALVILLLTMSSYQKPLSSKKLLSSREAVKM
jgi:hypothetical protein